MPLNVRRLSISFFLVLAAFVTLSFSQAASVPPANNTNIRQAPTSGEVMRDRISKAKAYIAVRNYNAAIYELESIRKETGDPAVQAVVNVLLMNSYLEQGDFKRAQEFLGEFYNLQKTTKAGAQTDYMAIAGQIIKGARARAERYRALGLNLGDRTLPLEALNDLEKMRETVELVITQSKEIGKTPARTADAMALLEEATQSRSMIARDDYDAKRWRDEVADTRETMANSRSVILSAVNDPNAPPAVELVAETRPAPPSQQPDLPASVPANTAAREREATVAGTSAANTATPPADKPVYVPAAQPLAEKPKPPVNESKPAAAAPDKTEPSAAAADNSPMEVGPLLAYVTDQRPVIVPTIAKMQRLSGEVKVEVLVDENGRVARIEKTSGPALLQGAAKDSVKNWKFKPFVRDGRPVQATGFVSFNFNL
jgi:TonB family protein